MSLSIHDLERSVGADLLRRPTVTGAVNAFLLRFYSETLAVDPDAPPLAQGEEVPFFQRKGVPQCTGVAIAVLTHVVALLGLSETVFWIVVAFICHVFRLPRIYVFEKVLVDVRSLLAGAAIKYVEKSIHLRLANGYSIPRLRATRQGVGGVVVTTVTCVDGVSRDSIALFKLLRYANRFTITFVEDDKFIIVGRHKNLIDVLCDGVEEPLFIPLGWHQDCVEQTTLKLSLTISRQAPHRKETAVKFIGRRVISTEIFAEANVETLEMCAHMMDQFAAVCEAGGDWHRFFNGKRMTVYLIGLVVAIMLIVIYEEEEEFYRPAPDVLTLAVGAFTLWMTIGKSAALGDTGEMIELDLVSRRNFLLAFHGLARVHKGVVNACWVPEVHRVRPKKVVDDRSSVFSSVTGSLSSSGTESSIYEEEDGSVTVLEAAVHLSIFEHFGHFVKWRGKQLVLDEYVLEEDEDLAHIVKVRRIEGVKDLEHGVFRSNVQRIGGVPLRRNMRENLCARCRCAI